jgi:Skp family chaperone for outer membrane proteins
VTKPTAFLRNAVSRRRLSDIAEQENRTVKKAVLAAGICLALGVLWYVGPLSGQTPNNQPVASASAASTGTRIAILNLTYVINKYVKYQHFKDEMKTTIEPFQKKHESLQQQLEELRKQAAAMPRQQQSEQGAELEKKARDIQHQMEDNKTEIQLRLGKRNDEEMKIIYMDVYQAVQSYATSHRYDLVLHYNDAITPEDFMGAQNIARKLNTGALMPLFADSKANLDISMDIVKLLNESISAPNGTPPQGTQPVGGTR